MTPSQSSIDDDKVEDTIKAILDKVFTIALDSLPAAGYKWTLEYDSNFLRRDDEWYISPQPDNIGSGIVEVFSFTPIRSGKTDVVATYKRPWEEKADSIRKFEIRISDQ